MISIYVGIGKTVKEKVCVHTSRDIRAIASQLVSVWVEIFRKEKASNGGLKLLRQSSAADASKSKSNLAFGKPPLRANHTSSENKAVKGISVNANNRKTKPENKPSSSQGSAGRQNCNDDDYKDLPMSEEEQAAFDTAETARAAAIAAAEVCFLFCFIILLFYYFLQLNRRLIGEIAGLCIIWC